MSSVSNNGIKIPFIDVVIKYLLQTLGKHFSFYYLQKAKCLWNCCFIEVLYSISDWKYTKSIGIKDQVFLAGPCCYTKWYRACKRTKSKQKQNQVTLHSNWPRVLLLDLVCKECNGIVKEWLHCLTSESKGRFLVNNILIFGSAKCLVMVQIQFSSIKIIKIGRPEHLLPPPPTSDIILFLFCPSISECKSYVCHPLKRNRNF